MQFGRVSSIAVSLAGGTLLTAACIGRPTAAPLDVAKITSVRRYKAHNTSTLEIEGQPTMSLTNDFVVDGPSRFSDAVTESSDGQTNTARVIGVDGTVWLNTGAGWTTVSLPISPQQQSLWSAPFLQPFANLKGKVEDYHGVWANHYQGTLASGDAFAAAVQSSLGALQSDGAVNDLPPAMTISVDMFDLWVRMKDQAPLSETVLMTVRAQGETGHVTESTTFSDLNGSDIDVEPPTS